MKLKHFKQLDMYRFVLTFESGEIKEADLLDLIGQHVAIELLHTAHNPQRVDWPLCVSINPALPYSLTLDSTGSA
jgi:hypothetical protein